VVVCLEKNRAGKDRKLHGPPDGHSLVIASLSGLTLLHSDPNQKLLRRIELGLTKTQVRLADRNFTDSMGSCSFEHGIKSVEGKGAICSRLSGDDIAADGPSVSDLGTSD